MTQDEIIEMARQTGWHDALLDVSFVLPTLTDFAKLVAAKAIAELESQEPVAYLVLFEGAGKLLEFKKGNYIHGAKIEHIPLYTNPSHTPYLERLIRIMGTFDLATGHADTFDELLDSLESELRDVLGYYRQHRTWVGLTDEEIEEGIKQSWVTEQAFQSAAWWAEAKLKDKNCAG